MEKREPSYTVGGNVNWYNHYGEQYGGIYWKKTIVHKDTCNPNIHCSFTTIAKTWKQPKCPSTEEKMWYIYTVEYYSAIKKHEIMPFAATWMDREVIILSEVVSQTKTTLI